MEKAPGNRRLSYYQAGIVRLFLEENDQLSAFNEIIVVDARRSGLILYAVSLHIQQEHAASRMPEQAGDVDDPRGFPSACNTRIHIHGIGRNRDGRINNNTAIDIGDALN